MIESTSSCIRLFHAINSLLWFNPQVAFWWYSFCTRDLDLETYISWAKIEKKKYL